MVSQTELISKGCHSFVPGLISIFRDGMGPFKMPFLRAQIMIKQGCLERDLRYMILSCSNTDKLYLLFINLIISLGFSE